MATRVLELRRRSNEADPLWLAATVLVGEWLVLTVAHGPSLIRAIGLVFTAVLVYFLLHRSRVAWLFAVFAAVVQLVSEFTGPAVDALLFSSGLVLICLLAPKSIRAVWGRPESAPIRRKLTAMENEIESAEYTGTIWLWKLLIYGARCYERLLKMADGLGRLIAFVLVGVLVLTPAVGVLYRIHVGSGKGSLAIDVLWFAAWIGYNLVRLLFVGLLIAGVHRWLVKRRVSEPQGGVAG